jgi:hypothetical protein
MSTAVEPARQPHLGSRAIDVNVRFFEALPAMDGFAGVADAGSYRPLPDGWALAAADVVGSTEAIADGRYKAVNMAGAAVIAAIQNAVGHREIPFVFGGDGAIVAVEPGECDRARDALAAVQTWVTEDLHLVLRAALIPVDAIRAAGHDVRAARFELAPGVSYAMFAGGGANWADREMKAGRFLVPGAPSGARPDLTGLSCRWRPIPARNGTIVSIIALPRDGADLTSFASLVAELLALLALQDRDGHPIPVAGPELRWPPAGIALEVRTLRRWRRTLGRARVLMEGAVAQVSDRRARVVGGFDARQHRADVAHNSDFRKYEDGLKMTVDVSHAVCAEIEAILQRSCDAGVCRFGLHRQDEALLTCIVPSHTDRTHIHFVDGAAGGYALAASMLKAAR